MIVASYGRAAATGQANWGLDDGFRITMERRAEPLCASRGATDAPFLSVSSTIRLFSFTGRCHRLGFVPFCLARGAISATTCREEDRARR
jgi:hypothetical protein